MGASKSAPQNPDNEEGNEGDASSSRMDDSTKEDIPKSGIHAKAYAIDYRNYTYPFENLVFEGGGAKGLAFVGALRVLEEINISVASGKIKRLAGTSSGAMTSLLVAIGYNSHEIEKFMSSNVEELFLDSRYGYLSLIPNIFKLYGWNPGDKIYNWFGERIKEKLGNPDITFLQLYKSRGVELCVVVVNLNSKKPEYCHHKTCPDMPIRLAARMSMSIPIMFAPKTQIFGDHTDYYVDGGVICNFPIHAFDGWWLSTKPEDSFFKRITTVKEISTVMLKNPFKEYNEKTMGFMLFSDGEEDLYRTQLQSRYGTKLFLNDIPDTKLGKKYKEKAAEEKHHTARYKDLASAMNALLSALDKFDKNNDNKISFKEFKALMNDPTAINESQKKILFDSDQSIQDLFGNISDHDESITFQDIIHYLDKRGLGIQKKLLGYSRRDIESFSNYVDCLQSTLLTNVGRIYMEEKDVKRTVGINTGHVGTTDFEFEKADQDFAVERGRKSAEAFLKYFVVWNKLQPNV